METHEINTIKRDVLIRKPPAYLDVIVAGLALAALIVNLITGNWFMALFCILVVLSNIQVYLNKPLTIKVNTTLDERNLFEIKTKNTSLHFIANSFEETNLYCLTEGITGEIQYIGKVKYFS